LKNRSIISFIFGFFVIAVLCFQMIDSLADTFIENDTIELSELNDDVEEEEDLFEDPLFCFISPQYQNDLHVESRYSAVICAEIYNTIFIKIPFPPPELAAIIS
jgi:hypothetical protein